jgi:hypothetical protein
MKGKGHPVTHHAGTEGPEVQLHSFLTSALDRGTVVNTRPRSLYPQERASALTVQKAGWAPGPVWRGVEQRKYPVATRVRTPNRPGGEMYRV